MKKFCVSLTHAHDNADKATVAFVIANAALASDQETLVFLCIEGVNVAPKEAARFIFALLASKSESLPKTRS